jgi:POT family proton-dependent oligopeptide transporter
MLGSFTLPAGWFQSLNPVFVLLLAPLFASLWLALAGRGRNLPAPAKFGIGLLLLAAGFGAMIGAAELVAAGDKVLPTWLVVTYLLHTMGEMALAPVGLSATTKLAPQRFQGQMMGVWFLGLAVGNLVGGLVAGRFRHDALEDMPALYTQIVVTATLAGALMLIFARPIRRLMGNVE